VSKGDFPHLQIIAKNIDLSRSDKSFARELKRCQVGNSDNISTSRGVEDNVQRVQQTVIGEHLKLLLEVIGSVQKLDLSIELTGIGVQQNLNLVHGGIKVYGMDSTSLNVTSLVGGQKVGTLGGKAGLGIGGSGIEGEVTGSGVIDIDGGGLVPGSDEGLNGAHETVLGVGLDLHGGPVGSDPQFDEGFDGAAIGIDGHLHDFLVGVGEFPVLTRLTLDADRAADGGEVPF